MSAPWGGIFQINTQQLLERSCLDSGLQQQSWKISVGRRDGMVGVGAAQGGQASVPSLPVTAACWHQHIFPSGESLSLLNQVFYRLWKLSAKVSESRVGSEGLLSLKGASCHA